jgi:hypothetical protein
MTFIAGCAFDLFMSRRKSSRVEFAPQQFLCCFAQQRLPGQKDHANTGDSGPHRVWNDFLGFGGAT